MSNFMYSAASGELDPLFGKFINPIKMLIENESNQYEKNKSILDVLFNVEKSNRFAETVMGMSDFDMFQSVEEGQGPVNDSIQKTFDKTIEHIEFKKEFTITKKMADDSKFGIGADVKNRTNAFVRAYYRTRIGLASKALINGTQPNMVFGKSRVDLTVGDGLSLFNNAHKFFKPENSKKTQTNYYYGDLTGSAEAFEEALGIAANNLRNVLDENLESLGYTADILIVPCNRPKLEMLAKKTVGTERTVGSNNNDLNTQYGGWSLVVLDNWRTDDDRFMVMSSEANKNLQGNMFYNRVKLDMKFGEDPHTRNMFWNGYTRMGVGFSTWKHIALYVNSSSAVTGATKVV